MIEEMVTSLSLKSADASFRAEDESLKVIKNLCQKSYACTHESQREGKKIEKESAEKPAGCDLLV